LKVLHVIPAVAQRYGGPSQVVFEMCRALQRQGADVLIATTDADGPGSLPVETRKPVEYQGAQTIFFQRQWSQSFGYSLPLARWLNDNVRGFDVVHIHAIFSHPCLAAARACRKRGVPYIVRPLGSLDPWSMKQKTFRKRLMWHMAAGRMLQRAAAVHYTAREEQRLAERSLGLGKGFVIPLGIETENLNDAATAGVFRRRHQLLGDSPYVLALSRIHPKKNIELLLEAFLSLAGQAEFQRWRLVIAGDGEAGYKESLRSLAKGKGGAEKVLFPGWLDGPEKASAFQDAALFALPSRQENFGLAVIEALACGVPALVSEHVNLAPEIAGFSLGWVTSLEPDSFSATLAKTLRNQEERKRRGEAGRNFVARQFSWAKLAVDLTDLYHSVAGGGANSIQRSGLPSDNRSITQ
jgi:glycosyltransferase involved in cell wall biosynthesis